MSMTKTPETYEERLLDLERLMVRQADQIQALETALRAQSLMLVRLATALGPAGKAA